MEGIVIDFQVARFLLDVEYVLDAVDRVLLKIELSLLKHEFLFICLLLLQVSLKGILARLLFRLCE